MNIQANLPALNLVASPKNAANRRLSANENIDRNPSDNGQAHNQLSLKKAPSSELLDKVQSLEKKQNLHLQSNVVENKKSIQSYLDTQSLTNQDLRDELHEQLGVDVLA